MGLEDDVSPSHEDIVFMGRTHIPFAVNRLAVSDELPEIEKYI